MVFKEVQKHFKRLQSVFTITKEKSLKTNNEKYLDRVRNSNLEKKNKTEGHTCLLISEYYCRKYYLGYII